MDQFERYGYGLSRTRKDTPESKWKRWSDLGVKSWPVPKWYKRITEGEERAHRRRVERELQRDPEAAPAPRKHKKDNQYYW